MNGIPFFIFAALLLALPITLQSVDAADEEPSWPPLIPCGAGHRSSSAVNLRDADTAFVSPMGEWIAEEKGGACR